MVNGKATIVLLTVGLIKVTLTVPVDLSKVNDVVKNDVVENDVYNAKIKNIEDKIPDITNLATNDSLNAKMNEPKGEIPNLNC